MLREKNSFDDYSCRLNSSLVGHFPLVKLDLWFDKMTGLFGFFSDSVIVMFALG